MTPLLQGFLAPGLETLARALDGRVAELLNLLHVVFGGTLGLVGRS